MVSYKPTFALNPLTNINIYLSPHATPPTLNVPFHIALHFAFDAYAPTMTLTNNAVRNLWTTSSIEVTNLTSLKPRYDVLLTFLVTPLLNPNLNKYIFCWYAVFYSSLAVCFIVDSIHCRTRRLGVSLGYF